MQGDWCLFLDCDDFLADGCFSKAKEQLAGKEDAMLCVGRSRFQENGLNRQDCIKSSTYFGCPTNSYITNRFIPAGLARQFRFWENVRYGEDETFNLEMRLCNPTVLTLEEPLYFYRMHSGQTMALNTLEKHINRLNSVIASAIGIRKKYGLENSDVFRFFRERNELALIEIERLRFYKRFWYLCSMKMKNLLAFKRNDPKGRASLLEYWSRNFGERKLLLSEKLSGLRNPHKDRK